MINKERNTHLLTSERLVWKILKLAEGKATVKLKTTQEMIVDDFGLIHGGFVFGLADYTAMLAVNEPTVVLGKSETKFIKPVKIGGDLVASATITHHDNHKKKVAVEVVNKDEEKVFEGDFYCYILKKHVLE